MYKIKVEIPFRAGHRLLPPFHGKCNNVHGEGFTAIIEFRSKYLDKCGMVFDFGPIKRSIKEWIDTNWDHAYLHNEKDEVGKFLKEKGFKTFSFTTNPTAEHLAEYLFLTIHDTISDKITKVGIVESFRDSIAFYVR